MGLYHRLMDWAMQKGGRSLIDKETSNFSFLRGFLIRALWPSFINAGGRLLVMSWHDDQGPQDKVV